MAPTATEQENEELRTLLSKDLPEMPCRFFYDDDGMRLFDQITRLPEYYQTETETAILKRHALDIVGAGRPASICELGAGEAVKVRVLIEAGLELGCLRSVELMDVNREAVVSSCAALAKDYPALEFEGHVADLTVDLSYLGRSPQQLVAYLGGSFGNFKPAAARKFLSGLAEAMQPRDGLLLGVDLVKDPARLEAAYDDSQGVTAAFNRNALRHMNRVTGSDFDPESFEHVAFYDPENRWVELRLRATRACRVRVPSIGFERDFEVGDEIRTEVSCKYTRDSLEQLVEPAGFTLQRWFTDDESLFALALLQRSDR